MSADAGFGLRPMNRLRILEALYRHPASSRGDLARHTGLSRATISTLAEELLSAGLAEERSDEARVSRATGRPPVLLSLVAGRRVRGRTRFRPSAHPRRRLRPLRRAGRRRVVGRRGRPRPDREPRPRAELVRDALEQRRRRARIGCSVSGWASRRRSTASPASSRPTGSSRAGTASGRPPRWRRGSGCRLQLENDANVGALGEKAFGAARGVDDLVYIRLSAGIGAGLILDGRPYQRSQGSRRRDRTRRRRTRAGPICRCGNRGCLEAIASPVAVAAPARAQHRRARLGQTPARARRQPATAARGARWPTPARPSAGPSRCSSTCSTPSS